MAFVGRKFHNPYAVSHERIVAELGPALVHHAPISSAFSAAMGDYGYLVRAPELATLLAMANFNHALV